MKLKNDELIALNSALGRIINDQVELNSMKVKFLCLKLKNKTKEEFQTVEQIRIDLVKKYGDEGEAGYTVKPENMDLFVKEYTNILGVETENDYEIPGEMFDLILEEKAIKLTNYELTVLDKIAKRD